MLSLVLYQMESDSEINPIGLTFDKLFTFHFLYEDDNSKCLMVDWKDQKRCPS